MVNYPHRPVMVHEVVDYLIKDPEGTYVDATAGTGGHSEAVGKVIAGRGRLICLDRDPEAIRLSGHRLASLGNRVSFVKANFAEIARVIAQQEVQELDGILLDLGMSTLQLDHSGRGFSFNRDEPLDMRMDPEEGMSAAELIKTLPTKELERILRAYGEERRAKSIARKIDRERKKKASTPPGNWPIWWPRSCPLFTAREPSTRRQGPFRPSG